MKRDFLRPKPGYIHRERLDKLLEKGLNYPLISVVAGPGYGKTMAVAGFALHTPMRLAWLRVQETDNDIYRFWTHFTAAVKRELPELAEQLRQTTIPAVLGVYDVISQLFSKELRNESPILLVLDNFEVASTPHIAKVIQLLIRAELDGLHIILISNEKLPIGGIVPSGGQLRVSMDDLRFTNDEIAVLFREYGLAYTQEEIEKIAESTDSWPLALHLICVNQSGENVAAMREMTHQQLAAELFEQHYFAPYGNEMRQLLVKLSSFEHFPLELVKALVETDVVPIVDELSRNVFISYDYTVELFQFQNMYRAFLSHRRALLSDEQKAGMYIFMGKWYLEHDYFFEALDCFWQIRDYDQYLQTLFLLPKIRHSINVTSDILQALDRFPPAYVRDNPAVDYCRAVLLLNGMRVREARRILLGLIDRLLELGVEDEENRLLLGDIHVVLADISLYLDEDSGMEYMKKAVEYLPNGCRVRTSDLMLVGNNTAFYLPGPEAGQLRRMVDYYFEYVRYADQVANGSGYGFEWLFAGQAAFLTEEIDKARENCFQAIAKAKIMAQHDIICNAYWELMRIELYSGDYPMAKQWLDELVNYVDSGRITDLYELRDCASSWFYIRVGDYDKVAPWVSELASIQADNLLEVGRNRIIIIYYLCEHGRFNEAYAEITRLEEILRNNGRWQERNLLFIHKAIRVLERGDKPEAIAIFKQAYDMVYGNRIAAIFAEFGKNTQRLIRAANAQTEIRFDKKWLDIVYKKAGSFEKRAMSMKRAYQYKNTPHNTDSFNLNAREREILTHIAQGMTRSEIALHMNTSVSNVKRYINNIYTKLGALNRADAIHIATLNGIISDMDAG